MPHIIHTVHTVKGTLNKRAQVYHYLVVEERYCIELACPTDACNIVMLLEMCHGYIPTDNSYYMATPKQLRHYWHEDNNATGDSLTFMEFCFNWLGLAHGHRYTGSTPLAGDYNSENIWHVYV